MKMRKRRKLRTSKAEINNRVFRSMCDSLLYRYNSHFGKFKCIIHGKFIAQYPHFWKQS